MRVERHGLNFRNVHGLTSKVQMKEQYIQKNKQDNRSPKSSHKFSNTTHN